MNPEAPARIRTLSDPVSGKVWESQVEGGTVRVRTLAAGKEKIAVKDKLDTADALKWAEKEEWSRLRQGFVLSNPMARPGEPRVHRHRSRYSFGSRPAADFDGKLVSNRANDPAGGDHLFLLDADAQESLIPAFPETRLAWACAYSAPLRQLLVNADHQILSWREGEPGWVPLSAPISHAASCLHIAGTRAVWYEKNELVIHELATRKDLLRLPIAYELHAGHSPQMQAALSPNGETVACCARAGEVTLWDVASGRSKGVLTGDFAMVEALHFADHGAALLLKETYGRWGLYCYDLDTLAPRRDWSLPRKDPRAALALSPDGQRIALTNAQHVDIFDFATQRSLLRFRLDHMVRSCTIAWVGGWLGVLTDYGCASLYVIE